MCSRRSRGAATHVELHGVERLLAACAGTTTAPASVRSRNTSLAVVARCVRTAAGSSRRSQASGTPTACGTCSISAWTSARCSRRATAISTSRRTASRMHVAAWRANHATVRLLIERGSPIDVPDGKGRTPLALAVRACVDSYWMRPPHARIGAGAARGGRVGEGRRVSVRLRSRGRPASGGSLRDGRRRQLLEECAVVRVDTAPIHCS